MSTIYDVANVKGFIRMCNDGWLQGWHELNGGNLTYRMTDSRAPEHRCSGQGSARRGGNR